MMTSLAFRPRSALRFSVLALMMSAATFALAPAAALGKVRFPTISKISPKQVRIGEKLTIRGKYFIAGKQATTVVFQRTGDKPVLAKAEVSTKGMLQITVPPTLTMRLAMKNGYPVYTDFRVRVLTKRLGQRFFSSSVNIGPSGSGETDTGECAEVRTGKNGGEDLDGDFLTNAEELGLVNRLDPCSKDSDGDTLEDGWEYFSAKDLNQKALPYPGKRPFPNALDPVEVEKGFDYDGDGLTSKQEFDLWKTFGKSSQTMANRADLLYSDGTKTSAGPGPNQNADLSKLQVNATSCGTTVLPPSLAYLGAGYTVSGVVIEDDEKDADQDGLGNWAEANGTMTQAWWTTFSPDGTYPRRNFADTDVMDADSDGDGCLDGIDDQDNDDWPNWTEYNGLAGTWADGANAWGAFSIAVSPTVTFGPWTGWATGTTAAAIPYHVHAFNPCLPDANSRTCSKYIQTTWAPFTESFRDALCRKTISYRGAPVSTWVIDPVKGTLPAPADCP